MSTACKLDPRVRQARSRRRAVVQTLHSLGADRRRTPSERLVFNALANELDGIRKFSARTGADKEKRFAVIMNRTKFQSPI